MEKRTLLAIVLSMAVLLLWSYLVPAPPAPSVPEQPAPSRPADPSIDSRPDPAAPPTPAAAPVAVEDSTSWPAERLCRIETDRYTALFSSWGGAIASLRLKGDKYVVESGDGTSSIDLVTTRSPGEYPMQVGLRNTPVPFPEAAWFEVEQCGPDGAVYRRVFPPGVSLVKRYRIRPESYVIELAIEVANDGPATLPVSPALRLTGLLENPDSGGGFFTNPNPEVLFPIVMIDGKKIEETDHDDFSAGKRLAGMVEWAGIDRRYFLLAVVPEPAQRLAVDLSGGGGKTTRLDLMPAQTDVLSGSTTRYAYSIFAGPKFSDELAIAGGGLDRSIDYWVLDLLARPMLWILKQAYRVVPNYGFSILVLVVIVKLLLYPLTKKSYLSMARMKDLKPKMDLLREKHKNDRQEMNRQMMELYKREGVNPMSGCLPMLLQMPVFIALYKMLQSAVELYNAPFIPGWLDNMADKDPFFILPLILGGLMFVQQKMTPVAGDEMQAKMMLYMMPVMMTFFMLFLPSGLVLYILVNTVVSIMQQQYINKRFAPAGPAPARA